MLQLQPDVELVDLAASLPVVPDAPSTTVTPPSASVSASTALGALSAVGALSAAMGALSGAGGALSIALGALSGTAGALSVATASARTSIPARASIWGRFTRSDPIPSMARPSVVPSRELPRAASRVSPYQARASLVPPSLLEPHVLPAETQVPARQVSKRVHALPSSQPRPLATGPHTPSWAAPATMLHATQSTVLPPPQALSQQTPSTQNFDGHCAAVEHEPAGGDSDRMRARTRSTG